MLIDLNLKAFQKDMHVFVEYVDSISVALKVATVVKISLLNKKLLLLNDYLEFSAISFHSTWIRCGVILWALVYTLYFCMVRF